MSEFQRINIIGPGHVGQTLMRLLVSGTPAYRLQDVMARRPAAAEAACDFAGGGRVVVTSRNMRPADIWILTVPDSAIALVAESLAEAGHPPAIAIHCSGFHPSTVLAPLAESGWKVASAHPVISFADPALTFGQFPGCHCGIEGAASEEAGQLFDAMGAQVFPIRTEAKALYHAAAVISNNFTTVLQALARDAWAEAGVPGDVIDDLHATLLRGTVDNVLSAGPRAALTGPAARGDTAVVTAQAMEVEAWNAQAGALYRLLSDMATRLKTTGTT